MQADLFVKQHFKDDDATTMAPDSPIHGSPQSSDDEVFWQRQTEKRRREEQDKTAEKMLDYESRTIISSEKNNNKT